MNIKNKKYNNNFYNMPSKNKRKVHIYPSPHRLCQRVSSSNGLSEYKFRLYISEAPVLFWNQLEFLSLQGTFWSIYEGFMRHLHFQQFPDLEIVNRFGNLLSQS